MDSKSLQISSEPISDIERRQLVSVYRNEIIKDVFVMFFVFSFLGLGLFSFLGIGKQTLTFGAAFGVGIIGVLAILVSSRSSIIDFIRDVQDEKLELICVRSTFCHAADLNGRHVLAIDCGENTLLMQDRWWDNIRRTDINWSDTAGKKRFPTTQFTLRRLPNSGRIVAVLIGSSIKLSVDRSCQLDIKIAADAPRFDDCFVLDKPLEKYLETASENLEIEKETKGGTG